MILYLGITALALAAAWADRQIERTLLALPEAERKYAGGEAARKPVLLLLLMVLTVPLVLRQATGNDYMKYVEFFHLAWANAYVPTEAGFNVLARLVYGLCGYENYLLLFAIYGILTCTLFVAGIRREAQHFFFSFFLFMMFGYYFQSYNTVRYYFALSLTLVSVHELLERRRLTFAALILAASLFHKSVLVVFLLYPLAMLRWRKGFVVAGAVFGASLTLFQDFWMKVIVRLYPSYEDTAILEAGGHLSVFNVAKCLAVFALALAAFADLDGKTLRIDRERLSRRLSDRRFRFYANASVLALAVYCFGWFIPEISRIGYYLMITQIFWIPMLVQEAEGKKRKALTVFAAVFAVCCFAAFLSRAGDIEIRILPDRSFLFHDLPATPSRSIR